MNKKSFDERQKLNRYKHGMYAFYMTIILSSVYYVIRAIYPNLVHPDNESSLLSIPFTYFMISNILTTSCITDKYLEATPFLLSMIMTIFGLFYLFSNNAAVISHIAEHKLYSEHFPSLLGFIEALLIDIACIIRFFKTEKNNT